MTANCFCSVSVTVLKIISRTNLEISNSEAKKQKKQTKKEQKKKKNHTTSKFFVTKLNKRKGYSEMMQFKRVYFSSYPDTLMCIFKMWVCTTC